MIKNRIVQKLIGLTFIVAGVLIPIADSGDATASVLFIPLGLCLLFTGSNYITVF